MIYLDAAGLQQSIGKFWCWPGCSTHILNHPGQAPRGRACNITGQVFFLLTLAIILILLATLSGFSLLVGAKINKKELGRLLGSALVVLFILAMVLQPGVVFAGSVNGLKTWWNIVFPSLLPFFIASELLIGFGIVKFMGVLLEPVMRPIFNVPGTGSFVMAMGYTSGFPIGAVITTRLRENGLCTRLEAQRLLAFTNNSSPLFMLVAVPVGMFSNPALGYVIAGAHYLANLSLGLLLRFYGRNDPETCLQPKTPAGNIFLRAVREMLQVQREDPRPAGKILGDAVKNSVNTLLNIGGFIILFAVIIQLLTEHGWISILAGALGTFMIPLGFNPVIMPALASGLFEMTIGTRLVAETSAPLSQQLTAVAIILAWSGICVQAQVASIIAGTDLKFLPFILARLVHAALAALYTVVILGCTNLASETTAAWEPGSVMIISLWPYVKTNLIVCAYIFLCLVALAVITGVVRQLRNKPAEF